MAQYFLWYCSYLYTLLMEFSLTVGQELYDFSQITTSSYLVTGRSLSIIIYKGKTWRCADIVPEKLVIALGAAVDSYTSKKLAQNHY